MGIVGLMAKIEITQAGIDNISELLSWRMEVLRNVFSLPSNHDMSELCEENRRYYEREIPRGGHIACFASLDGETVGCGGICLYNEMPSPDNPDGRCAYLMNIYCREAYRHKGVGRTIVSWLVGQALDNGIKKIYLETSTIGRRLYDAMGFQDMKDFMQLKQ